MKLLKLFNKTHSIPFLALMIGSTTLQAQVGIGTATPHASAQLEVQSTSAGLLIPRITAAEKTAINSPTTGLLVYQTDGIAGFWYFDGTDWYNFAGNGWSTIGNAGTTPATHFLGTTDNQDLVFVTNNLERMRVQTDGDVGIKTTNPTTKLHVTGVSPALRIVDGKQGINKILTSDTNGYASWETPNTTGFTPDNDWIFRSGTTYADPIYHRGKVVIGKTGTTTHHLDVDNGASTGTTIGIGDVELITDGNNETLFSHNVIPNLNNNREFGDSDNKWRAIYSVNGTIQTSDVNEKTDIRPIPYGINEVMRLQPVTYNWKEEKNYSTTLPEAEKELKIGFIAQELQKIIPETVVTQSYKPTESEKPNTYTLKENNVWGVQYEMVLPILVKAKQEQDAKIQALQARVDHLLNEMKLHQK